MKVKTYRAINMQEAIRQIKNDLGPQAVILSTRKVVEGKRAFGLLGRPIVEVTAAMDHPAGSEKDAPHLRPAGKDAGNGAGAEALQTVLEELRDLKREVSLVARESLDPRVKLHPEAESELKELKWWVTYMFKNWGKNGAGAGPPRVTEPFLRLVNQGVKESLAASIIDRIARKKDLKTLDKDGFDRILHGLLSRLSKVYRPLESGGSGPVVLALVGPTGVGKTTTAAKLAARLGMEKGKKVALVTNDTYRIAAVEQLRTYARIMGIPMEVVLNPSELREVISRFSDRDVILMDTSGRSPFDRGQMAQLEDFLGAHESIRPLLMASATTNPRDLDRLLHAFSRIGPRGLIITKLDEARDFGTFFSASLEHKLPFAFFGTGQRVPEDIREATKQDASSWTLWGVPSFYPSSGETGHQGSEGSEIREDVPK